ncbi:MAG: pyruvate formate lyase activating enzyme [Candidatus Magnetoglobus multicellularis str. Araruama]|uniref:Pyruvate formate lyase activating enzyme n=1 Tax=Candidatus Magnetoglobus multicellularis str. Araruama TaxID=890399 RepID=A0A1V1P666_9BACT|nr:MAG: pyruvate formate lyase activating enzyme [Candidatus Magnetoglobus multicellularis str. Araruama]
MKEALLYEKIKNDRVICHLCNHQCTIQKGRFGICNVRQNKDGILYTHVYDRIIAEHIDPIEKKPLFHFLPGSKSYSVATVGCNFKCRFCQNANIAQMPSDQGQITGMQLSPQQVVQTAINNRCKSISYTYTEPTIYFEFALDTARKAHDHDIKNVFVSNGFMSTDAIKMIGPYLDAANIDLKSFDDKFYRNYCGGKIQPVLDNLVTLKENNVFIEITTLIITGLNDQPETIQNSAEFIVSKLGADTPWHLSRFHPTYRLQDRPATPVKTLQHARQIGMDAGLHYVFTGNVPGDKGESTFCHQCGKLLIDRFGFSIQSIVLENNQCPNCQTPVNIVV